MKKSDDKFMYCIGCGAGVLETDGSTHKYLGASPGCWKIFGYILAKEYSDPAYMTVHRLTVDAYALQHPGDKSPQTIQSVNLHLMALCAALEYHVAYPFIPKIMNKRVKEYKGIFTWLTPPESLGNITVVDVAKATHVEEHEKLVQDWAKSVWNAWSEYHKITAAYLHRVIE